MNRFVLCSFLFLGLSAPTVSGATPSATEDARPISGRKLPELDIEDQKFVGPTLDKIEVNGKRYLPEVIRASEALDMEPGYAQGIRQGLELVFQRDYKGARKHFADLDKTFPGTGISAAVNTLMWQALMIENFDFRYNKQYEVSYDQAMTELKAALKTGKHLGWTHFLIAGLGGVQAIHLVRHSKYVAALSHAFTALEHAEASRKAAPDFVDLNLADGMYNYWVTVITKSSNMLPDFGDNRVLGIQQLQTVEREGFFLRPAATLALSFSWLQEGSKTKAIAACERNRKRYPNNVINNLLTGQAYLSARKREKAIEVFEHLHRVAPENNRAYYYKGLAQQRLGKRKEALKEYNRYLNSDHLEDYQRAWTHYRIGQVNYMLKNYAIAEKHYLASIKADGLKPAKSGLARMRKARRDGKISY